MKIGIMLIKLKSSDFQICYYEMKKLGETMIMNVS